MKKICKGDEVIILAGKDKGKYGKVLRIIPKKNRAIVEGMNIVKKTVRNNPNAGTKGEIKEIEASLHLSNLAIFNTENNKADKVKIQVTKDGEKILRTRVFKSNDKPVYEAKA